MMTPVGNGTHPIYGQGGSRQLSYHAHVQTLDTMETHAINVLINSGCTKSIMDLDWAKEKGFNFKRMHKPMVFKNVDGTENVARVFCYSINIHLFLAGH